MREVCDPQLTRRQKKGTRASMSLVLALTAAALAAGVYLNTLHNPFVFDDVPEIINNQSIRRLDDIGAILRAYPSRPLVNLTYAIDYARGGLDPFPYHVTNLVLHVVNVLLLFVLARSLFQDSRAARSETVASVMAFATAALFAVHPLMTETVGYVASRAEVLGATFFLASLLAFRKAFLTGSRIWLALTLLAFVLGLASKETVVTLPLVLLAYLWLVVPRDVRLRGSFTALPWILLAVVTLAGAGRVWLYVVVEQPTAAPAQWQNGLIELRVFVRYVELLFYPAGLSLVQSVDSIASLADWNAVTGILGIVIVVATAILARARHPLVSFGIFWFLIALMPSAALLLLAAFGQPMAEHRVYLPSCGFFVAVTALGGATAGDFLRERRSFAMAAAAGLVMVIAVLMTVTVARNRVWQSPVTLWEDAARKAPRTWSAAFGLAEAHRATGDYYSAGQEYARAIGLNPNLVGAYSGLAITLVERQQFERARLVLREAVQRVPATTTARALLAQLEVKVFQDRAEALRLCREVASMAPPRADAEICAEVVAVSSPNAMGNLDPH